MIDNTEYIFDMLLANILDQIFIQRVIEPCKDDIMACLTYELNTSVLPSQVDTVVEKNEGIQKVFKLINAIDEN